MARFYDLKPEHVTGILQASQDAGRLYWSSNNSTRTVELICTENATPDSEHYGKRIARFGVCYSSETSQVDEVQHLVNRVQDDLKKEGCECVYARAHLDDIRMIHALQDAQFKLMDVLQTLRIDLKGTGLKASSSSVRSFVPSDVPNIVQIARDTFTPSRFFIDPHFSREEAREYYARWAHNCCSGLADDVLVTGVGTNISGFITVRIVSQPSNAFHPYGGAIDLVRVHPSAQRRGLGTELTKAAVQWFSKKGIRTVLVGTEVNNLAALNCYLKVGFRAHSGKATFHRWL